MQTPQASEQGLAGFTVLMLARKKSYDDALLNEQILLKELDLLNDSIEKASVKAPIKGVVLEKYANLGELASPAKPLFKLADTSKLRLKAYILSMLT